MLSSAPASATGFWCTITTIGLVAVQPFVSVTVTVYTVLKGGVAVGLATDAELIAVGGVQLYL
jgi:hypothetical protein